MEGINMTPTRKRNGSIDSRSAVASASLHERLTQSAAILSVIDRRRHDTGSPGLGQNVEKMIIDRELRDLSESFH